VVAFASLANRGFCTRVGSHIQPKSQCKLKAGVAFFALEDFEFEMYSLDQCPLCQAGSEAIKPGSRN